MTFDARGGISVLELIVYFPALVVAAIVCSRHGFGRSSGWVFTLILCLVRVIGACCQLATYQTESLGLIETVVILESLGISPLLLATLGLLSRCVDSFSTSSTGGFQTIGFRILQLTISLGLILCIVGGTSSTSSTGVYTPQSTTKAGIVLYLLGWIALCFIAFTTMLKASNGASSDKRLVWAVIVALPIILIRLIYSFISVFTASSEFNLLTGSIIIHVFMAILEEMIVVCLYLAVGWTSETLAPTSRGPVASRPWKGNLAPTSAPTGAPRTRHGRTRRQGPIHALVNAGISAAQNRNREEA